MALALVAVALPLQAQVGHAHQVCAERKRSRHPRAFVSNPQLDQSPSNCQTRTEAIEPVGTLYQGLFLPPVEHLQGTQDPSHTFVPRPTLRPSSMYAQVQLLERLLERLRLFVQ